jgi:trimeric autotransporter adhesin
VINTSAGNGSSGDGGPASSASLGSGADGVAADALGNLYIAGDNRTRKVSPPGLIATVAGNSNTGYSGDGGPAKSAQLNQPFGVALDVAGNVYIAESAYNVVRKVTPEGTITTIAGNASGAYSGDGGPATSATLSYRSGVALDPVGKCLYGGPR